MDLLVRERADGEVRLDEYFVRATPFDAPIVNFQIGKFATVVGNFVLRHYSWQNPFVTAPLPYERVTAIGDYGAVSSEELFLTGRDIPDRKRTWLPIVWGPSYASGLALFGRAVGRFVGQPYEREVSFEVVEQGSGYRVRSMELGRILSETPEILDVEGKAP